MVGRQVRRTFRVDLDLTDGGYCVPEPPTITSGIAALATPILRPEGPMSRLFTQLTTLAGFVLALELSCIDASAGGSPVPPPPKLGSGASSADASSWVAGGHAGYNWQR